MDRKYLINIQPFPANLSEFYFKCSNCGGHLRASKECQAILAAGGIGHKCTKCERYFAFFGCPCCGANLGFDDLEWEQLFSGGHLSCEHCSASLVLPQRNSSTRILISATPVPELISWSDDDREKTFVSKAKKYFKEHDIKKLAIYHITTGSRIKASELSLEFLKNKKWRSGVFITNDPLCDDNDSSHDNFNIIEFDAYIFSFINSLRSALDILAQELNIALDLKKSESKIDIFMKENKKGVIKEFIPTARKDMQDRLTCFLESNNFIYLNSLRNVAQHRRIPYNRHEALFATTISDNIKPAIDRPTIQIILPDDPKKGLSEIVFSDKEIIKTFEDMSVDIKNFIFQMYDFI